jgi:hypothetical protein
MKTLLMLLSAFSIVANRADAQLQKTRAKEVPKQLPPSCTLMSMTPIEREQHVKRLHMLSKASRLVRKGGTEFVFTVDLKQMAFAELQLWASKEQACCSFLKIDSRVTERKTIAEVRVECPAHLQDSVIQTFGLAKP